MKTELDLAREMIEMCNCSIKEQGEIISLCNQAIVYGKFKTNVCLDAIASLTLKYPELGKKDEKEKTKATVKDRKTSSKKSKDSCSSSRAK